MNRRRVGTFFGEFWHALVRDTTAYCRCGSRTELATLRVDLAHARVEADIAHASFCRACHGQWRLVALDAQSRAEAARLRGLVAMLNRMAVDALADPTYRIAFAESVRGLTDTHGGAAALITAQAPIKGES